MSIDIMLLLLLVISVYTDLRSQRIYNKVLLPAALLGLGFHIYQQGIGGLLYSLQGLGAGLALLIVPFLLGGMGAGDVKLLGVVGVLKGAGFVFASFIWIALVGGLLSLLHLLLRGQLRKTLAGLASTLKVFVYSAFRVWNGPSFSEDGEEGCGDTAVVTAFPYGLAIALGVLANYLVMYYG